MRCQIDIIDNYNSFVSKLFGPFAIKQKDLPTVITDLSPIANKSLIQLKEDNPNLLIFPEDLSYHQDGFDDKDKMIFSLYPEKDKRFIETGNVMGWIGCGNTHLRIYSRFDSTFSKKLSEIDTSSDNKKNNKFTIEPKKDFFMYYLLSKVGAFHLTAWDYTEGEGLINNLLMLMLPECLRNAVSQGLYKEYQIFEKNDSNVRGTININQHIRSNFPFTGKVAYRTREFSFDNDITQLIRHTIEYMKQSSIGVSILENDATIKECVEVIYQATPSYNEKNRGSVINKNLRPKIHPYFTDYITLQKLCLQILHEEGINYGIESEEKVHGILFDGAWLWEAYINRLLIESGEKFVHPDNIAKTNAFKMFKTREDSDDVIDEDKRDAYPDFYNDTCVLDAKYKHLEKKVQREDLFQVISYMHTMPRNIGGYVYPYQSKTDSEDAISKTFVLNGNGGKVFTIPFRIPYYDVTKKEADVWKSFSELMKSAEEDFIRNVKRMLDKA